MKSNYEIPLVRLSEQDFNEVMELSGLSEDELIEKLNDEGWEIGGGLGTNVYENIYWPPLRN